ncbi:unnamed protein product [Rotaria sordida]|uniref:SAP domain-containing protein n=1 Tax=Rotaria sordida TaxID=392033 RepID=A0A818PG70_9BILA|nr:unnamed protein product [Rotaria sordida]
MLQHLSSTSPYVCDLSHGPIEPANRMASTPTKKITALLEQKESFPKTRTPLKLLGPDEIPMDSTTTTTTIINDINASLQPVWYTEQTIVDDHHVQQEDDTSIIQEKSQIILTHSTLPPIQSESPSISEDDELPLNQPSLMHKSSTFIIEPSMNIDLQLNDLDKENLDNDDKKSLTTAPSDESFRALEHLLGLGSSTTTIRESPKTNHDTLSLTVVTPTDIINSTTTSVRMSYAPKTTFDNLPLSQDIPIMPTIESINTTNPPSFLMENTTTIEDEQPSTTINQQNSFDMSENKTNTDDEANFSFELNDFSNNSKTESIINIPEPSQPIITTIRAPTCADVAYRALIKPRSSARLSQPVKADSPLATSNKPRSSAPASRILRSSSRRISTNPSLQNSIVQEQSSKNNECSVNNENNTNLEKQTEFVEIVSVLEEDENEQEKTNSLTLNLTSSKSFDEINHNMSNQSEQISTPIKSLMPLLSREYTYTTPKRRSSQRRRSMLNSSSIPLEQTIINEEEYKSPSIPSKSMLNILLTNPTEIEQKSLTNINTFSPIQSITKSPSITSKSMLGILLTNPTDNEQSVLQETLTTSIRPSLKRISTRQSKRLSTNLTPRVSINPLHSSTPSTTKRRKTLQMVSISEQEQILTTVPHEINNDNQEIAIIPITNNKESIQQSKIIRTIDTSVQTTPSLNNSSRRYLNTIEQQTTPIVHMNKSISNIMIHEEEQQQQQISPMQTKMVMSFQRNVRFQLTPTTDARLTEKEQLEENLRGLKPDIIIHPRPITSEHNQKIIKPVKSIRTKKISKPKKKVFTTKKKNITSNKKSQVKKPLKRLSSTKVLNKKPKSTPTKKKHSQRKRPNVEVTIEPAAKRTKTSKPIQTPLPSLTPSKTRTISTNNKKHKSESIERQTKPPTTPKTNKKNKSEQKQSASKKNQSKPTPPEKNIAEPVKQTRGASKKNKSQSSALKNNKSEPIEQKRNHSKKNQSKPTASEKTKTEPTKQTRAASKKNQSKPTAAEKNIAESIEQKQRTSEKNKVESVKQTRSASKKNKSEPSTSENKPEPIEQKRSASKNKKSESNASKKKKTESIERPVEINIEPKTTESIIKTRKRPLESVEKNEELKKKIEIQNIELNQEERQKIEELTVAELKSRLNKHKENIPKGAKKADLIALLIKLETNLLKADIIYIEGDLHEMDSSSYTGLPNKLFQGLTSVKSTLTTGHILEKSEKIFIEKNDTFHHHMARSVLGIQAPLKLKTELQIANKLGRLPCLPSSRLMVDVLRGTNEDISFEDILNNPYEFGEHQIDPHLAMDKQDRLF